MQQKFQQVQVLANYFTMEIIPGKSIYKSTLRFDPPLQSENCTRVFIDATKKLKDKLIPLIGQYYMILNSSLYSTTEPEILQNNCLGEIELGNVNYTIYYELRGKFDTQNQSKELLSFYGRILKRAIKTLRLQEINRKFYDPSRKQEYQRHNLEIWPGYVQKLNQFGLNCFINVDMSYKIIRQQDAWSYLKDIQQQFKDQSKVQYEISGKTVMTKYNKRMYVIDRIEYDIKFSDTFEMHSKQNHNSEIISYLDYYQKKYNCQIKDVNQPFLVHKERRTNKEFYLVPELCVMTGLTDKQRSDFNLMKDISQQTKCSGNQRMQDTAGLIKRLNDINNQKCSTLFKQWNIQISDQPLKIESFKLDAGQMILGKDIQINYEGNPNFERENQAQMFEQEKLERWGIIYNNQDQQTVDEFMKTLQQSMQQYQYMCQAPKLLVVNSNRWEEWKSNLEKVPTSCDMIICILGGPKKNGFNYKEIKEYLTNEKGVPCQCVCSATLKGKGLRSIVNKILVQICAKQGGIPWYTSDLPFTDAPTMIIGIDTYHKTMAGNQKRSVLAVVASLNNRFSKYWSSFQILQPGQEFGTQLGIIFNGAINGFMQATGGKKPKRLIVYRDGVSIGQREITKTVEATALRISLDQLGCQETQILFICINKKVDAKFYKIISQNELQAPQQGTVVETAVVEGENDFYLISQKTLQGIPTPSHYHILVNELLNQEDPNYKAQHKELMRKIQILSYKLCYQYYNFTGSIKVPCAIQYAHRLSNLIGDKFNVLKFQVGANLAQLGDKKSLYFI